MLIRCLTTCSILPVLLVAIELLVPSRASAQGGRMLRWNDCVDMGGTGAKDFACNTNEGFSDLVASFYVMPPQPEHTTGLVAVLELVGGDPLASYWRLQHNGCRAGEGTVSFSFTGTLQCRNPWSAGPPISSQVTTAYVHPPGGATPRLRIEITASWPEQILLAVQEYYAFRLRVNHARTTGAGACEGCCEPMTAHLETMYITQTTFNIGLAPDITTATWNASGSPLCGATPTRNTTWGLIKGLYR